MGRLEWTGGRAGCGRRLGELEGRHRGDGGSSEALLLTYAEKLTLDIPQATVGDILLLTQPAPASSGFDIYSRVFARPVGIDEDPVVRRSPILSCKALTLNSRSMLAFLADRRSTHRPRRLLPPRPEHRFSSPSLVAGARELDVASEAGQQTRRRACCCAGQGGEEGGVEGPGEEGHEG